MSARSALTCCEHVEPHVLDVDRADAVAPVAERLHRIAAGDEQVAGVEQQLDVGVLEEALDLGNALDIGRRVVVEDRLVAAARARCRPRVAIASTSRRQRASSSRSAGSSPPRPGLAIRSGPPASQSTGARRSRRPRRTGPACAAAPRSPPRSPRPRRIAWGRSRRRAAGRAARRSRELVALAEVAGRAEVGARVAGGADRLEDALGVGDGEVGADGHLEGAVGERRVGDPRVIAPPPTRG